ncbi:hypothetical protein SJA_C1-29830 [Sphingobium indicum UT26S]|uniref:Uncharacterized protein n=1 Tax=Sphingobium indicum (strain DSM 16413 / CCM 7287 / MTCC 6362 / UT26 / NBRC 101211 / UT26S) TaxID=452662 RepID=D4Z5D5_SPHIU|nr:hypothetical protein SJA_C1-29830 [Sphingobium indicum UT26S]
MQPFSVSCRVPANHFRATAGQEGRAAKASRTAGRSVSEGPAGQPYLVREEPCQGRGNKAQPSRLREGGPGPEACFSRRRDGSRGSTIGKRWHAWPVSPTTRKEGRVASCHGPFRMAPDA